MAAQRDAGQRRFGRDFSLGGEQAEADPFLEDAFYDSGTYAAISSHDDPHCFLIGRTGSGKSALIRHLEEERGEHVIRITPEDLSLPYITDLGVFRYLDAIDVNLDPLFIALWKHVFLVEVIRHRYRVDSPEAKTNFLTTLTERIQRDPAKQLALEYLDEFEGRFWCETDERLRDITARFEEAVDKEAKATFGIEYFGLSTALSDHSTSAIESRVVQTERFQRLVNETQLPRLNKMMSVLDEDILDSPQNFTYIVIDDLDRDWVDVRLVNDLIRCLFRTVLDLKRIDNLKVLVALRTNLFEELDFGKRGGGQEEKFRALAMPINWTPKDLIRLLDERVHTAGERAGLEDSTSLASLLPRAGTEGKPLDWVLSRTLLRPRDAIAFFNTALRTAEGETRLRWMHIKEAEPAYSHNRLLALRDEWKGTYPGIDEVFNLFKHRPHPYSREELSELLDDAVLLPSNPDFPGVAWMTAISEPLWGSSDESDWSDEYGPLVSLLFRIGFLGLGRMDESGVTYAHEDPDFAEVDRAIRSTEWFSVHRMFRAALDVRAREDGGGETGSDD